MSAPQGSVGCRPGTNLLCQREARPEPAHHLVIRLDQAVLGVLQDVHLLGIPVEATQLQAGKVHAAA